MIKMKSVSNAQHMLSLMGTLRNFFSTDVGRYKNPAQVRRDKLISAISMWQDVASQVRCV